MAIFELLSKSLRAELQLLWLNSCITGHRFAPLNDLQGSRATGIACSVWLCAKRCCPQKTTAMQRWWAWGFGWFSRFHVAEKDEVKLFTVAQFRSKSGIILGQAVVRWPRVWLWRPWRRCSCLDTDGLFDVFGMDCCLLSVWGDLHFRWTNQRNWM